MNTIPGSAAKLIPPQSRKRLAAVDMGKFIGGDNPVCAEGVYVRVSAPRRKAVNLLRRVDAERRVDGRHHVLDPRLRFVVPTRLDAGSAIAVGGAQHQAALHSGPGEHRGEDELMMIAAG